MSNDTALILLLADRQREIEELRVEIRHLTAALEQTRAATDTPTAPNPQTGAP